LTCLAPVGRFISAFPTMAAARFLAERRAELSSKPVSDTRGIAARRATICNMGAAVEHHCRHLESSTRQPD
jgi:hypothetical protein